VLDGLLSAPSYLAHVERTLLVGTMNTRDKVEMECLFGPRNRLKVRFFSTGQQYDCTPALAAQLGTIEGRWGVRLLYGTRVFGSAEHEIILVDPYGADRDRLDQFKYYVWEHFGLDCLRYEGEYEFNLYMAAASPGFEALRAIVDSGLPITDSNRQSSIAYRPPSILLCHECIGLPLWYAAELAQPGTFKSAYVAHEVPTARAIVEGDPGHDTRFYNVLRSAQKVGLSIDEVFGDQSSIFRHAMVKTAAQCDYVLAVGDLVVDELHFVDQRFRRKNINLVYNGTPSRHVFLPDVRRSGQKLRAYANTLVGFTPTFIFSHVTRMVLSKSLWRDLRVMEALDPLLAARNESAVLFMLSSVIPHGRSAAEAQRMARDYGWPREHREGWPDLIVLETPLWQAIAAVNATARASRIVLINQYGFSRDRCGDTMPPDMQFDDLRIGTDLEFGQSIYEPFGIAQLEPLHSGALCVVSDVCGCLGFVHRKMASMPEYVLLDRTGERPGGLDEDKRPFLNVLMADYTALPVASKNGNGWRDALSIGRAARDAVEQRAAHEAARAIIERLPRGDAEKDALIDSGYLLAQQMSWEVVAREQLLPALTS
jgi:hypothetical protein